MRTILLIDDEISILQTLSTILKGHGYRVIVAKDAPRAEEQFVGHAVDLVIVDHGLPGVTGSELAKILKKIKCVTVLMLSGNPELLGKPEAVDALLPKPSSVPDLLAEIERLLPDA